ncbi:MAG: acyl carrier protein [Oscillospiraceae bacterium]|nr:acyl carrier protein [Oscillospiraceae bacterium]MDE7294980.1 acyl carrier protein [Oscillospiraceae bacterium]
MVFDKVKEIIQEKLDVEEDKITESATIQEDLGADSLDIIDLINEFEEQLDIEIPEEAAQNLKTVGDIVKYIEDHQED